MAGNAGVQSRGGFALKPIISSTQWQILLVLQAYYLGAVTFTEVITFVWKGSVLLYDEGIIAVEILVLLLLVLIDASRIFWGMKGNLTERRLATFISIALAPVSIIGCLYFILWQSYVLKLEVIVLIILMVLITFQTIFAILTFASIKPVNATK